MKDDAWLTHPASIVWAAQMGTITFHPWQVRCPDTDHPDELRIDLDPQPGTGFAEARVIAGDILKTGATAVVGGLVGSVGIGAAVLAAKAGAVGGAAAALKGGAGALSKSQQIMGAARGGMDAVHAGDTDALAQAAQGGKGGTADSRQLPNAPKAGGPGEAGKPGGTPEATPAEPGGTPVMYDAHGRPITPRDSLPKSAATPPMEAP